MPLSLLLVVRPSRAAAVAAFAALAGIAHGGLALDASHGSGLDASAAVRDALLAVALVLAAWAIGLFAPVHGRGARLGLATTRAGLLVVASAAMLATVLDGVAPAAGATVGLLVALAGLRALAVASRPERELPGWAYALVALGVIAVAILGSSIGGLMLGVAWLSVTLTIHLSAQRAHRVAAASA